MSASTSPRIWQDAVRALLAAHVHAVRSRWLARAAGSDEIDEILSTDAVASAVDSALLDATQPSLLAARSALAEDDRWRQLSDALRLVAVDIEWLALLTLCEVDPRLTRAVGYLDDGGPTDPTPALGALVWQWPHGYQPGPAGRVVAWRLAAPRLPEWRSSTPWALDPEVAAFVAGNPGWADYHDVARPVEIDDFECLHPAIAVDIAGAIAALPDGAEIELVGPAGSGRRTLLAQAAALCDRRAVVIDASDPIRALRAARLQGALPVIIGEQQPSETGPAPAGVVLAAREVPSSGPSGSPFRLSWELPALDVSQRTHLWERFTAHPSLAQSEAPAIPRAVREWSVLAGDVRAGAAAAAAGEAESVIRRRLRGGPLASLRPLACPYTWDDLIVPRRVADELVRLRVHVERFRDVFDTWELRRLAPLAVGTTALFAGPSGTGKTMAAQVLAGALGLELYQVDLAEVLDKYVGETEKRLSALFDQCERSHVMVLFDEADALFGRRTKTTDAHDRYANIEIDYLLQRLDSFRGIAVLATNRKSDLDPAFLRRLRILVDFVSPGVAERERLWQRALPERTASGVQVTMGLDYEWLSRKLELTGAEITAIAVAAAFDARTDESLITLRHVLEASRRELGKKGVVLRVDPPEPLVAAS